MTSIAIRSKNKATADFYTGLESGNKELINMALAKLKKFHPARAAKLEAELKAQEEAKAAAELKAQEEVLVKAKAEMQELTLAEVVKQNAELRSELAELSQLFHRFSDAVMKNDETHKQEIAELHDQIQEGHCSGGDSGLHEDMQ